MDNDSNEERTPAVTAKESICREHDQTSDNSERKQGDIGG